MKRQLQRILCYQCGSNHEVMRDFLNDVDICYPCIKKEEKEQDEYENEQASEWEKDLRRNEETYRIQGDN